MNATSLVRVHSLQPQGDPSPFERYLRVRRRSEVLIAPSGPEDVVVQSMPDASPAKWHLAHTSWFFETFLLVPFVKGYQAINRDYGYLFNSYYESVGPRQPRPKRGLLTRPPIAKVLAYRRHVDTHMGNLLASDLPEGLKELLELGLAHEEQHQELMLMDVLHLFSQSPGLPAYDHQWPTDVTGPQGKFQHHVGGLMEIGFNGSGFAFDNELPRHQVWLQPFEISDRLVTNGEWLSFMRDAGYHRAELWLSDGWTLARAESWEAPLYWIEHGGQWKEMTLSGLRDIDPGAPVSHISYFEAAAYAEWAGARLPSEAEWEVSADAGLIEQIDGVAWQWTRSAYCPYPGYRAASGALGEYNGKFMVGQMVLRGGASITPQGHSRPTYRNFYRPDQRWMASGLRLARDADPKEVRGEPGSDFAADVVTGLSARQKQLSPKYFYDGTGSRLFEEICRTRDYYVTRSETALLSRIAGEIAADIPESAAFVEFGSGESAKTRILLDAAPQISTYVPIDISADAIERATSSLQRAYALLEVAPVIADFTGTYHLPSAVEELPKIGFFPGSTIGNFDRQTAIDFLARVRAVLGKGAALLVGADLVKDVPTLLAAYNDSEGVTARFNKNLLVRINRELKGDFDLGAFEHAAIWNAGSSRMEMHLISRKTQIVKAAGRLFAFRNGEKIHTENSHKFTIEGFSQLALEAGWRVVKTWVSDAPEVAIFRLENVPQPILECVQ